MRISIEPFGTMPDGRKAFLYILENDQGMRAEISNLGGTIVRLLVPDKAGKPGDVVLGHPDFTAYLTNANYFGATVGRNANRIAGGQFTLAGKTIQLEKNNGENNLHSGSGSLAHRLFNAETRSVDTQPVLLLTHTIEAGSDGFPGNLTVSIAFTLTADNAIMIDYRAVSDADTVINLTNHSYFNLSGHDSGPVYEHLLEMDSSFFSPGTLACMPTGELFSVEGTPFDFRKQSKLGPAIQSDFGQITQYEGFDHNFALNGFGYRRVVTATDPASGRVMKVFTNLPAVQLYTGNQLVDKTPGKDGAVYNKHQGFCLETQFFPDAVHMPWLMSPIFRAGEEYVTSTGYQFSTI